MTDSSRHCRKIGVVLTGGGAKGAYQVGCLKALRQAGYTNVAAISGTSVGAMNGMLLAAGKLDKAEEAWNALRARDIVGFEPRKVFLFPLWILAAIVSEFSLAKVLKISDSLLVPIRRLLAGMIVPTQAEEQPSWTWIALALVGTLALLDDWSRRVFLGWIFTTNEPLATRLNALLSEDDVEAVQQSSIPVYATLSHHQPPAGWVPHYVRLDKLPRERVVDTLLQSAGFPGVFPTPKFWGRHAVDGGWTDNIPAAPLLFGPESRVDLLFVIKVDKTVARPARWKRLVTAAFGKLWGEASARPASNPEDLIEWSRARWDAHSAHDPTQSPSVADTADGPVQNPDTQAASSPLPRAFPRIVTVVPLHPLGSILTGTFWFSRAKAKRLIELGEQDMNAVLARADSAVAPI